MENHYNEITVLKELLVKNAIQIIPLELPFLGGITYYKPVRASVKKTNFELYIYDECNDLTSSNQMMNLYLFLEELTTYKETDDYLDWCKDLGLDVGNLAFRNYHMELRTLVPQIENLIGTIENPIRSFDYEFNTGVVKTLRSYNNS